MEGIVCIIVHVVEIISSWHDGEHYQRKEESSLIWAPDTSVIWRAWRMGKSVEQPYCSRHS